MKKEEVFVVIDTEKKAKKVAKVLAMFNQELASELLFKYCLQNNGYLHISENSLKKHWVWSMPKSHLTMNDTEVSVSELKQILAMEHLKKGDVVKFRNEKGVFNIFEITSINSYSCSYEQRYSSNSGFNHNDGSWEFKYFIRYATEEEKQLLNPGSKEDEKLKYGDLLKKEVSFFEIGKWYKHNCGSIANYQGLNSSSYGFSIYGEDGINGKDNYAHQRWIPDNEDLGWKEATQEEVAERFFKECHRRYPNKIGFIFNHSTNEITACDEIIFKNGTWLEAKKIEIDPFKELKEAHKKGFEIEYKSSNGQWKTSSNPAWRKTGNYRIRPRKIGDWFRTTNSVTNVNAYIQINETNINNVNGNDVRVSNQMVIDILNNGKYTV